MSESTHSFEGGERSLLINSGVRSETTYFLSNDLVAMFIPPSGIRDPGLV